MKGDLTMNSHFDDIRAQLRMARGELMKKHNVLATGLGYKTVSGSTTSDLAIVCSVEAKKPVSKLRKKDLVPSTIQNIPTDVKACGVLRALQKPTDRFRPAPGGVSIGHAQITAGTFGCLVKKNGILYILSNNHVLANSNDASTDDPILQPGPYDGGIDPGDQIAVLSEFVPIGFEGLGDIPSCPIAENISSVLNAFAAAVGSSTRLRPYRIQQTGNLVDCAIAKPLDPENVVNEIFEIGPINDIQEAELGMKIKKSGRTTGLTTGTIEQIDVSARVSYGTSKFAFFEDQLMAGAMSQGGDSGSAVLSENNNLIGLLFAGSETSTIINRINHVFSSLDVVLP